MANTFKSKLGLIAATVGSAVGLGTVWRFPAETQAGGGAAFLLVYIGCVLLLGIPVMLAEFALGRSARTDAMGAYMLNGRRSKWESVGLLNVLTSFFINGFYLVVTGWTIEYLFESITGGLYAVEAGVATGSDAMFADRMAVYIQGTWWPLIFTAVAVAVNLFILLGGVTKGIERLSNLMMPMLFVILVGFMAICLALPGAADGVRFFLEPDFSKITLEVVLNALGQAFFSLSLGMGVLVTYAGYYPDNVKLGKTAFTVSSMVVLVAIMMGLIIFPAVFTFGLSDHSVAGTALVFVTLPEVFAQLPGCRIWSALFFLLLAIAAITSTISITEVSVRFVQDRLHLSRRSACFWVLGIMLAVSCLCSLSLGPLSHWQLWGRNLFDFLDFVTADIMLPLGAFGLCLYVGWAAPRTMLTTQLTNGRQRGGLITRFMVMMIRWVAPVLILLILLGSL